MNVITKAHIEAVEAVNNAKTQAEYDKAYQFLRGFRNCLEASCQVRGGYGHHLMECDNHYMDQGIDRPMCCGVFLDWEPA